MSRISFERGKITVSTQEVTLLSPKYYFSVESFKKKIEKNISSSQIPKSNTLLIDRGRIKGFITISGTFDSIEEKNNFEEMIKTWWREPEGGETGDNIAYCIVITKGSNTYNSQVKNARVFWDANTKYEYFEYEITFVYGEIR